MGGIFSRIVKGEIRSYKVAEDDRFFAFLDINPIVRGHTLVIPKVEVDKLFDLDDQTYQDLFAFCKKIASSIEISFPCNRVGMSVIGLEVPHAHVHLVTINKMSDIDFTRPKLQLPSAEMIKIAALISQNIR